MTSFKDPSNNFPGVGKKAGIQVLAKKKCALAKKEYEEYVAININANDKNVFKKHHNQETCQRKDQTIRQQTKGKLKEDLETAKS